MNIINCLCFVEYKVYVLLSTKSEVVVYWIKTSTCMIKSFGGVPLTRNRKETAYLLLIGFSKVGYRQKKI